MRLTVKGNAPRRPKQTVVDSPNFKPDPLAWSSFVPPTESEWRRFVNRARDSGNQTLIDLIDLVERETAPRQEETAQPK